MRAFLYTLISNNLDQMILKWMKCRVLRLFHQEELSLSNKSTALPEASAQ